MREQHVSWKQAQAWGWMPLNATFAWTGADGRRKVRGDRLGPGAWTLLTLYARRSEVMADLRITRRLAEKVYVIEHPPTPDCKRCGKTTWDLNLITKSCRDREICRQKS